ncbi:MAG: hypothetical protein EXR99_08280 [Gemmataceae bacterium]|nr:hypothetical protein [Gemmataceae bacterium]
MDQLDHFISLVKSKGICQGRFLGFLHILVAYHILDNLGKPISTGMTWREAANRLRKNRWNPDDIELLGLKGEDMPQRDRLRYWYVAIVRSGIGSEKAAAEADALARNFKRIGFDAIIPPKK